MPLVNTYNVKEKYPLSVNRCVSCCHLQLNEFVSPSILYRDYSYCSGTGRTALDYFSDFARTAISYVPRAEYVLDIASNDGSQLDAFKEQGLLTYGIDPAENLEPIAAAKGHAIWTGFFENCDFRAEGFNSFDIITAQNVVAHTPEPLRFLENCSRIMADHSRLFLATSQANMIVNGECDTCLLPDQLVVTNHGFRPIQEIKKGDVVLTHLGNWKRVTHTFVKPYKGLQLDIYAYGYNRPLRVTPEHPVYVDGISIPYPTGRPKPGENRKPRKSSPQFIPASQIRKRDHLLRASMTQTTSLDKVSVWSKKGSSKKETETAFAVNESLMKICGYYLAEGFFSRQKKKDCVQVEFAFGHSFSEQALAEDCQTSLSSHGASARLYHTKYGWRVCTTGPMARMLHEQFGTGAFSKRLPSWSFMLSKKHTQILVKSYADGDGYSYREGRYLRISTVSEKLAEGVSLLANKLGWSCSVNIGKSRYDIQIHDNPRRTEQTKPLIDILIRCKPDRVNKVAFSNGYQVGTVYKIEEHPYCGMVYNLEVEDDNSYVTPQGSVHNCYHEHVSYFNAHSMMKLATKAGLIVLDIIMHDIHGTSYVFVLGKTGTPTNRVRYRMEWEQVVGMLGMPIYSWWVAHVQDKIIRVHDTILKYQKEGYWLAGCGAAAKGISMLNMANVKLHEIFDNTPTKWNRETSEMRIVPFDSIEMIQSERVLFVILAWNVGREIRHNVLKLRDRKEDVFIETR